MTLSTTLLLLLSLVIAGGLSFFQYFYKAQSKYKLNLFLAVLRFLSLFLILLLLINPLITRNSLEIVKPPLAIVVDNSGSIIELKADKKASQLYQELISNSDLKDKFDVQTYQFDSSFEPIQELDFKGKATNFDLIAKDLKTINKNTSFPTVIITDGNQTNGSDYVYIFDKNNKVFPVVVGDTTRVLDLKIAQLNVNKYAFNKNKFPVEVFLQYSGRKNLAGNFSISQGKTVLSKQNVSFSPNKNTAVISVLLPADKVGTQVYTATISSKEKEVNGYNNSKKFAVEIIDQKTKIALITTLNHPDLAAFKKAIESNAEHEINIVNPNKISSLKDYNVLILYQPTAEFKKVFEDNKLAKINTFVITGTHTDFGILNQYQKDLSFAMSTQKEDYLAAFNPAFNLFATDNIGFEDFPPLENTYGNIAPSSSSSTLLFSKIRSLTTDAPLLIFSENSGTRASYLLGENSWKWRIQSHATLGSFEKYDLFVNKIIQFLASKDAKKSLVVAHERFYNSGDAIEISAQYFNKNYEFDERAHLTIALVNTKTKRSKNYDLLKGENNYKVNLDGLEAGNYNFKLTELNTKTSYSSQFEVLEFDIEKQFVNPDVDKLNQLATNTSGKLYFSDQINQLTKGLLADENYKSIQKNKVSRTPLIDWYWILIFIVCCLSTEWFVRKYNGLL